MTAFERIKEIEAWMATSGTGLDGELHTLTLEQIEFLLKAFRVMRGVAQGLMEHDCGDRHYNRPIDAEFEERMKNEEH